MAILRLDPLQQRRLSSKRQEMPSAKRRDAACSMQHAACSCCGLCACYAGVVLVLCRCHGHPPTLPRQRGPALWVMSCGLVRLHLLLHLILVWVLCVCCVCCVGAVRVL